VQGGPLHHGRGVGKDGAPVLALTGVHDDTTGGGFYLHFTDLSDMFVTDMHLGVAAQPCRRRLTLYFVCLSDAA